MPLDGSSQFTETRVQEIWSRSHSSRIICVIGTCATECLRCSSSYSNQERLKLASVRMPRRRQYVHPISPCRMFACRDTPFFCRRKIIINISMGFWSRVILAITKPAARRSHSGPHIHGARRVALYERNEVLRALRGRQFQVAPLDWQVGALACVFMRLFQSPNRFLSQSTSDHTRQSACAGEGCCRRPRLRQQQNKKTKMTEIAR